MKKMVIFLAALAMIAGFSTLSFADLSSSKHNLQQTTEGICIYCHTPHNSDTGITTAPLWNHTTTAATFTLYDGSTGTVGGGQVSGVSALCLSCHDGVTNVDAFGGSAGSAALGTAPFTTTVNSIVGTNLQDDHPVMVAYPGSLPAGEFVASPAVVDVTDGVQCSSCHDPHDDTQLSFLRESNAGSALCLECHVK